MFTSMVVPLPVLCWALALTQLPFIDGFQTNAGGVTSLNIPHLPEKWRAKMAGWNTWKHKKKVRSTSTPATRAADISVEAVLAIQREQNAKVVAAINDGTYEHPQATHDLNASRMPIAIKNGTDEQLQADIGYDAANTTEWTQARDRMAQADNDVSVENVSTVADVDASNVSNSLLKDSDLPHKSIKDSRKHRKRFELPPFELEGMSSPNSGVNASGPFERIGSANCIGGDLSQTKAVPTREECEDKCAANIACAAYVWCHSEDCTGGRHVCFEKDSSTLSCIRENSGEKTSREAGIKTEVSAFETFADTYCPEHDIDIVRNVTDMGQCQTLCDNNQKCGAYVWCHDEDCGDDRFACFQKDDGIIPCLMANLAAWAGRHAGIKRVAAAAFLEANATNVSGTAVR